MHLSAVMMLAFVCRALSLNESTFFKSVYPFKKCLYHKDPPSCLKSKAFQALNETIMDDRPIVIGFLEIQKNPEYFVNGSSERGPSDESSERGLNLGDVLMDKIEEFVKSRTVKVHLSSAFEGRKGGGGGGGGKKGGGGMAMMAVAGMAGLMANMMMGKIVMMSASAMMMAKISLILSLVMILKKLQEKGGGGDEKHIVYADTGSSGKGYGGGGWHRSLEEPHIVYKGQWNPASDNGSDDGFFYFRKTTKTWY